MSAFQCSNEHINEMVSYAKKHGLHGGADFRNITSANGTECASFLLASNLKSLQARYPNHYPVSPEPVVLKFTDPRSTIDMVTFLKLVDCFEYQSCEGDDWYGSSCDRLLNSWRKSCISNMTGYDAAPWGI